jgi:hypothetical protein
MKNKKQYLMEMVDREILGCEKEIKESDKELESLELKLKVEKELMKAKDLDKDIKDDVKYSVIALENIIAMEKNNNIDLKKDLKISKYRKVVIEKFKKEEL